MQETDAQKIQDVTDMIDADTNYSYEKAVAKMYDDWKKLEDFKGSVIEYSTLATKQRVLKKICSISHIHEIR